MVCKHCTSRIWLCSTTLQSLTLMLNHYQSVVGTSAVVPTQLLASACTRPIYCTCLRLALFPARSHLQYLIAYSMQIRRGKAWEIWSRVVMSGRHMGTVPDSSISHFVSNCPWRYERRMVWHCLANALACSPRIDSTRKSFEIPHRALSPMCLPSVCLT